MGAEQPTLFESQERSFAWCTTEAARRYQDRNPGCTPKPGKVPPVGAVVDVYPTGYVGSPRWRGRIRAHIRYATEGEPGHADVFDGITVVQCTDPADFPNYRYPGCVVEVETALLRPLPKEDTDGE